MARKFSPKRFFYSLSKYPPQIAYALGLGPLLGRVVLLLTTVGRKSGQRRVTPLQYERIGDDIVIGSATGPHADWYKNIVAHPEVDLQVGSQRIHATAEPTTDPERITDFLEYRLQQHPRMIATIMRADGIPANPTRADLRRYAQHLALVVLHPTG